MFYYNYVFVDYVFELQVLVMHNGQALERLSPWARYVTQPPKSEGVTYHMVIAYILTKFMFTILKIFSLIRLSGQFFLFSLTSKTTLIS